MVGASLGMDREPSLDGEPGGVAGSDLRTETLPRWFAYPHGEAVAFPRLMARWSERGPSKADDRSMTRILGIVGGSIPGT